MNVLIVNAICYTSEQKRPVRTTSIKDTMIYDFCLAFHDNGHKVVLYAAEPYKPTNTEKYPFEVIWDECVFPNVFLPNKFPFLANLRKYIMRNYDSIDLIVSSEVFSMNSLNAVIAGRGKTIIWHELAIHNHMLKKIPSKMWYYTVPRFFMKDTKVIARSVEAREFIKQYCKNTLDVVIDHGVNLDKFIPSLDKNNYFVVCSQLIERKRIDGILEKFKNFILTTGYNMNLLIIGDGDQRSILEEKSRDSGLPDRIHFLGKMNHKELIPLLSKAKAMLVNTKKDNSMISIVESIAVGTPVITTEVPLNSSYIKKYRLGIAKEWDESDLIDIVENNDEYVRNCLAYREKLSTRFKADQFVEISRIN